MQLDVNIVLCGLCLVHLACVNNCHVIFNLMPNFHAEKYLKKMCDPHILIGSIYEFLT